MGQIQSIISRGALAAGMPFDGATSASLQDEIFDAATSGQVARLADLIDANQFDLTTLDDSTRETLLHRALASDQDDVVMMLLDRAGDDPLVIDAKDKDGYTPLMRATARHNLPMMQALVKHGARADGSVDALEISHGRDASLEMTRGQTQIMPDRVRFYMQALIHSAKVSYDDQLAARPQGTDDAQAHAATAQMLVEAEGDIYKAFELAVERRFSYAAKFYFDAQMYTVSEMQNQPYPRATTRWLKGICVRSHHIMAALEWAQQTDSQDLVKLLISYRIVSAILHAEMLGCSDADKVAVLKRFVGAAGARSSRLAHDAAYHCRRGQPEMKWTEAACRTMHFDHLRLLIAAGVRCDPLLIDIFEYESPAVIQKFGGMAIDCYSIVKLLRERAGDADIRPRVNALVLGAIISRLENDALSDQEKIAALRELPLADARPAVAQVMLDLVGNRQSLEPARLIIEAGGSTIDVLAELAKANEWRALLKFIRMGANFFPAIAALIENGEQKAAHLLTVTVALEYGPPGPGNPAKWQARANDYRPVISDQ